MAEKEVKTPPAEQPKSITPVPPLPQKKVGTQIVELAAAPEKILEHVRIFQELKERLLSKQDYQMIGEKKYIKKSGWRQIALAFNLSDEILKEERKQYKVENKEYFVWELTVRATAPNGRYADGTASCASNEKKFSHVEHDVRATAHTRAKNRAISDLVGGGEISAEEIGAEEHDAPATTSKPEAPRYAPLLASEKQIELLQTLTSGHGLSKDNIVELSKKASLPISKPMTSKEASAWIDYLKTTDTATIDALLTKPVGNSEFTEEEKERIANL